MASKRLTNDLRDTLMTAFRRAVCDKLGIVPFPHQAAWWLATDGLTLTDSVVDAGTPGACQVRVPGPLPGTAREEWRRVVPRAQGRAHVVAALGSFKIGKSFASAIWAAGFAAVPGARVKLMGLEYDTCAPEFEYLVEALVSERGMHMPYDSLQNRPRDGRMWLDLENGARYEARSWERKEALKGKEDDCYVYCLPLDAPVWMGDYSFKPIGEVRQGEVVIGWARSHPERSRSTNPARYETDRLTRAIVMQVHRTRDALVKVTMRSGRTLLCTPDHRWLTATGNNDYATAAVGRRLCHIIDEPPALSRSLQRRAAWLGGMYDGEGSHTMIGQSPSHNGPLYKHLVETFIALGYPYAAVRDGVRWLGGRQGALNFLNHTDAFRYRLKYADKALLGGRFRDADEIVAVEPYQAEADVACLTTSTGNFVAYGYASHNCEAYQLPGLECYTDFKQNLTARHGYAVFPTTPDRPWVELFHQHGHADLDFPDWQCVCGTRRDVNPYTFDATQKDRDRKLMTAEKFAIHYDGQIGRYLGSVFRYQRGQWELTPATHPDCFLDPDGFATRDNFTVPPAWEVLGAADTGTFTSAVFAALSPDGDLIVFDEVPNYRYIAGKPELDDAMSISTWKRRVRVTMDRFGVRGLWADLNSQFKRELLTYPNSILLYGAKARLEQRTEVLREYCSHGKLYLAPWLEVVPYEIEQAAWPPEATANGRFQRLKVHDHTLDGIEHLAALRPRSALPTDEPDDRLWVEAFAGRRLGQRQADPHLGVM